MHPFSLKFVAFKFAILLCPALAASVHARTLATNIAQIETAIADLQGVRLRINWPEQAAEGMLSIEIARLDAPGLGQHFERLHWQCPLRHTAGWRCEGPIRSGSGPQLTLAVELSAAATQAQLSDGPARFALHRDAATPDLTRLNLSKVPLLWLQSWLEGLWPSAKLGTGQVDGEIQVIAPDTAPLQVNTSFTLQDGGLETQSGDIAAAGLNAQAKISVSISDSTQHVDLNATLGGGEALIGNAYLALPTTPVQVELSARKTGSDGWQLPQFTWHDGNILSARSTLELAADGGLDHLALHLHSEDISHWPDRYLSGWLGLAGLGGLQLGGAVDADAKLSGDGLERLEVRLDGINLDAPDRFALHGLSGRMIHAISGEHGGELTWQSGRIGEITFGPAHWPLQSSNGQLHLSSAVEVEALNGHVLLDPLRLRLPHAGQGLQLDFGLYLKQLDLAPLSSALGWPPFRGQLTGVIPAARYIDGWLDLNGGLSMTIFDGRVDVTSLMMERPFGVAPTLSLDLTLMNLDLMAITEVFDFGSISGRMDGQIDGLRLLDWSPVAFTAKFHTVPGRGVRQRISQRAVQDISSVGGGGLMHSIQGQLLSVFKDFGYRRIGLGCRLLNEVCTMSGLHSAGAGFTIVEGAGLPRLNVVGFNREVDWPTLLERLSQIAEGAVPVVQ